MVPDDIVPGATVTLEVSLPEWATLLAPYYPNAPEQFRRAVSAILLARIYDTKLFRHGESGHMHLMLIAHLAAIIDGFHEKMYRETYERLVAGHLAQRHAEEVIATAAKTAADS
jgi:hypothetical protein